jgi:hypothetical protein
VVFCNGTECIVCEGNIIISPFSPINSMSLVNLAPKFVYIIDNDGTAYSALFEAQLEGYEQHVCSAQRFSLINPI